MPSSLLFPPIRHAEVMATRNVVFTDKYRRDLVVRRVRGSKGGLVRVFRTRLSVHVGVGYLVCGKRFPMPLRKSYTVGSANTFTLSERRETSPFEI